MPDASTPNLALPLLQAAQAQKHVTHNEALVALDTLVQLAVLDKDLTAPPASPAEGDRYLIASAAPTGAWAGFAGRVVRYQDGAWRSFVPRPGWLAFVADEADLYTYTGVAWASFRATLTALQNLMRLGIGTTADAANPFSAKLNKALWTALAAAEGGTGDLRYTLNKEAAGNVLSLLFQSGFSGRAELGLAGDDDLRLKVSADGSSWRDALRVDRATGTATLAGLTVSAIPVFPGLSLSGTAGSFRTLAYQTNGSQRFTTFVSQEPETGGNSGSHFAISRHGDTGAFLDNPLVISRTTGQTALQSLAVAGPAGVGGRLSVGSTSNPADAVLELATGQGGASRPWRLLHKGGASTAWPNYGLAIVDAYDFDGSGNVALGFDWSTRNVGIGVTSASAPAYRLDVRGNMGVSAEAVIGGTLTCGNQTSQYGTGLVIRESAHASGSKRAAAYFGSGWALLQDSAGSGVRDFVLFNLVSSTQALAVNPSNNALTVNGPLIAGTTIKPGTYIVSTLPAGAVGAVAYASNGRKLGEAANSGTGVLVCFSNGNWRRLSDDSPVAA